MPSQVYGKSTVLKTTGGIVFLAGTKKIIYDEWLNNSILFVDSQNGWESMNIRNSIYGQKYQLRNETELLKIKKINESWSTLLHEGQQHIRINSFNKTMYASYFLNVSLGSIWNLKPSYITYPTEREWICVCQICLNFWPVFNY